jgi:hypothetical protein
LFCESCKDLLYKRVAIFFAACAAALFAVGAVAASRGHVAGHRFVQGVPASVIRAHLGRRPVLRTIAPVRVRRTQPRSRIRLRATISLYEHTTTAVVLGRQGCRAAKRGVGGVVILDFGKPAFNGNTYGTTLFSNRFAGNKAITRGMLAYARGYMNCLPRGLDAAISLARGTSNYHPHVPNPFHAGWRWANETKLLQRLLRSRGFSRHVTAAAADDVEPAWDRTFWRTRDFYRGYARAHVGLLLYNYGSLDGGVRHGIWSVRQAFFVASGMRYSRAIPEIYNSAMAHQWADLARFARRRYHRPVKFAGVMTTHTSANHGIKPVAAHGLLTRALTESVGRGPASYVPPSLTNIRSAS